MYSSLSICGVSCGLHVSEGKEGTIEDMPYNETRNVFLKLEFNTCTVPLVFVEHPVSCMREKKKRAPT